MKSNQGVRDWLWKKIWFTWYCQSCDLKSKSKENCICKFFYFFKFYIYVFMPKLTFTYVYIAENYIEMWNRYLIRFFGKTFFLILLKRLKIALLAIVSDSI